MIVNQSILRNNSNSSDENNFNSNLLKIENKNIPNYVPKHLKNNVFDMTISDDFICIINRENKVFCWNRIIKNGSFYIYQKEYDNNYKYIKIKSNKDIICINNDIYKLFCYRKDEIDIDLNSPIFTIQKEQKLNVATYSVNESIVCVVTEINNLFCFRFISYDNFEIINLPKETSNKSLEVGIGGDKICVILVDFNLICWIIYENKIVKKNLKLKYLSMSEQFICGLLDTNFLQCYENQAKFTNIIIPNELSKIKLIDISISDIAACMIVDENKSYKEREVVCWDYQKNWIKANEHFRAKSITVTNDLICSINDYYTLICTDLNQLLRKF